MPGRAKAVMTIMYSIEPNGHVARHKFPFDANDKFGMEKLQRFVKRGFSFTDPRIPGSGNTPEVIVTGVVDLSKPIPTGQVDENGPTEIPSLEEMAIAEFSDNEAAKKRLVDKMLAATKSEIVAEVKVEINPLQCQCGFVAKSEFGLSVHQRKHIKAIARG